jgi:hypothetical protein
MAAYCAGLPVCSAVFRELCSSNIYESCTCHVALYAHALAKAPACTKNLSVAARQLEEAAIAGTATEVKQRQILVCQNAQAARTQHQPSLV